MFKGLCICYTVIISTYFSVAISGYWTFGNQSLPTILTNFMGDGKPLLPTWFLLMTNIFTLMQLVAITVVRAAYYSFGSYSNDLSKVTHKESRKHETSKIYSTALFSKVIFSNLTLFLLISLIWQNNICFNHA